MTRIDTHLLYMCVMYAGSPYLDRISIISLECRLDIILELSGSKR